jgi:hypothetical protein
MVYNATSDWSLANKSQQALSALGVFGTLSFPDGKEYQLAEIRLHFPSEHTVDNKTLAAEMQLVHADPSGSKVIVSILFEEDEVEEGALIGTIGAGNGTLSVLPEFQDQLVGSYYSYTGSMTVPPCTESVDWYIMQETAKVSAEQLASVVQTFGGQTENREVQPLNDRTVCFNTFVDGCLNMSVLGDEPEGGEEVDVVDDVKPKAAAAGKKEITNAKARKAVAAGKREGKKEIAKPKAAAPKAAPAGGALPVGAVPAAGGEAPPADGGAAPADGGGAAPAGGDAAPAGGEGAPPAGGDAAPAERKSLKVSSHTALVRPLKKF